MAPVLLCTLINLVCVMFSTYGACSYIILCLIKLSLIDTWQALGQAVVLIIGTDWILGLKKNYN